MNDKSAMTELAEMMNKHLTEPIKAKIKTLFSEIKNEKAAEFASVKLQAETFIKDNKNATKVTAVKLALEVAVLDNTKVEELKVALAEAPAETYNEVPLADGTVLKYTGDLAVGSKCLVVTAEGEVPAPEGDLILADGSTIVIKKEGEDSVISEIKPTAEMKDQAIQAMVDKAVDKAIATKFSSIKADLDATKLKLSKKTASLNDLVSVVAEMSAITNEEPIKKPNTNKPNQRLTPFIESRF